jgi:transcriptional regulator with XRE-family HTH domain
MTPPYMSAPWFALLQGRTGKGAVRAQVAKQLGISAAALSQVLNGSGAYGSGAASTSRIAERVVHTFGRYVCPHLSQEAGGEEVEITADQCKGFAHRPAPTGSPRDMQHWQACRQCRHREASAPPVARAVQPRKVIPIQVQPQEHTHAPSL